MAADFRALDRIAALGMAQSMVFLAGILMRYQKVNALV
jgi:hypothetical protein